MEPELIKDLYCTDYAKSYEDRFLLSPYSKVATDFELSILRKYLKENDFWLDVGCGTGYYLSFFSEIQRCGIDISESMLSMARKSNPNANFINGDIRQILGSLSRQYNFVSCMWTPYNYLDSMKELDKFLEETLNLICEGGTFFLPVIDLEDLRPHTIIDYKMPTDVPCYEGDVYLTSTTWSWHEKKSGKIHKHLIAPQLGYFLDILNKKFELIEVLRYPIFENGWVSRKAILATNRKYCDQNSIVLTPMANYLESFDDGTESFANGALTSIPLTCLIKEVFRRITNGDVK
jgi:SAM-dependent methyltransferase